MHTFHMYPVLGHACLRM